MAHVIGECKQCGKQLVKVPITGDSNRYWKIGPCRDCQRENRVRDAIGAMKRRIIEDVFGGE